MNKETYSSDWEICVWTLNTCPSTQLVFFTYWVLLILLGSNRWEWLGPQICHNQEKHNGWKEDICQILSWPKKIKIFLPSLASHKYSRKRVEHLWVTLDAYFRIKLFGYLSVPRNNKLETNCELIDAKLIPSPDESFSFSVDLTCDLSI